MHHEPQTWPHADLTRKIIHAAIEVHRTLGPGLLESVYEECLCKEFELSGIAFERQIPLSLLYKGHRVDCALRLDVLVEGKVVVELKAVEAVVPIHEAKLMTYMRMTNCRVGLLVNFNVPVLKDGITRRVI
jgi:GxxExxY protein